MEYKWPFFRTYKITCPDGKIRIVHKDINDLFPLAVVDGNTKLNGELKGAETVEAKLGTEITKAIKSVMFSIDGNNNFLVFEQRAAYSGYAADPCGQAGWYRRRLEDISNKRHRLQEQDRLLKTLLTLVKSRSSNKDQVFAILSKLIDKMPPEAAALITIDEMDASEKAAIEMTKEVQNDG